MRLIQLVAAAAVFSLGATGAFAATELITNGDFSGGNAGFSTGYAYVPPGPNALFPEGLITIAANPFSVHQYWVDLGPVTNPMLIVNGATGGGGETAIWEEDLLPSVAGQAYNFSADVMDICCNASFGFNPNAPSQIIFQINVNGGGWTDLASYMTAPASPAPGGDAGLLVPISQAFSPVANGTFGIRAIDGNLAASGNDFALDNISVTTVPEPTIWALMLIGFFGVGTMLRWSQRTQEFVPV